MKPQKPITLSRTERVLAVVPEYCAGPGWANSPLWVHIVDHATGTLRSECIQPEDQTPEQMTLFRIGAVAHAALVDSIAIKRSRK